jgi:hypothetical protein
MDMLGRLAYFEHKDNMRDEMEEGSTGARQYAKKRAYYPSNTHGAIIVNAITGVEYPWRVGSNDVRRLFRAVDTAGTHDKEGRKLKVNSPDFPNPNPNNYYYDSPEQFMQHRRMKLNPALVEQWHTAQQQFAVVPEQP